MAVAAGGVAVGPALALAAGEGLGAAEPVLPPPPPPPPLLALGVREALGEALALALGQGLREALALALEEGLGEGLKVPEALRDHVAPSVLSPVRLKAKARGAGVLR